jgi:hypothetical protein
MMTGRGLRRRRAIISRLLEPLPESLELILGDQIYIARENSPPTLRNRLLCLAAFQNPEFYRAQSMRLPTYGKPRIIHCAEEHPLHLALPRGCLDEVRRVLQELKIKTVVRDERFGGIPLSVSFCGVLRPEQQAAAEAEAYRRDRRRDAMATEEWILRPAISGGRCGQTARSYSRHHPGYISPSTSRLGLDEKSHHLHLTSETVAKLKTSPLLPCFCVAPEQRRGVVL